MVLRCILIVCMTILGLGYGLIRFSHKSYLVKVGKGCGLGEKKPVLTVGNER